ncbi:hypothetical protein [Donghicola eburneus]|uniref:Putative membrane protein n=1 Tax=Donghicola eburneus TaxID=393278 RepID=A0A1M4N959_9RHOB|nr:hypothetical protein [Donghicola eburneus]SCM69716.1 putative membrane protein [Donghicola eburneus]SFQ63895.1 hypothetical protein SAMN05421764_10864 [Donghicola eburneus]
MEDKLDIDVIGWFLGVLHSLNALLSDYSLIFTAAVVPIATFLVNRSTQRRLRESSIATEVSRMRHIWLNELRAEMSEFGKLALLGDKSRTEDIAKIYNAIFLRLNREDKHFLELHRICKRCLNDINSGRAHGADNPDNPYHDYMDISRKILKEEWERIKDDLKSGSV